MQQPINMTDVSTSKVQVYVRARPSLSKEVYDQRYKKCISFAPHSNRIIVGNSKEFTFDSVYDDNATQETVFNSCVKPLVESCFYGFNATIFAYGQTGSGNTKFNLLNDDSHDDGSGKTYTMGSSVELLQTDDEGIIPRVTRHIFSLISTVHSSKIVSVRVSFMEIYNEGIEIVVVLSSLTMNILSRHQRSPSSRSFSS